MGDCKDCSLNYYPCNGEKRIEELESTTLELQSELARKKYSLTVACNRVEELEGKLKVAVDALKRVDNIAYENNGVELVTLLKKQPDYLGGKRVLAKNVPDNYYSIYAEYQDPCSPADLKVLEHENNPCFTFSQIRKLFNHFGTRKEANAALRIIKKAYRGDVK